MAQMAVSQGYVREFREGTKVSLFYSVCTVHDDGIHESRFDGAHQEDVINLYNAIKKGAYGLHTECWIETVMVTEEHTIIAKKDEKDSENH